MDILTPYIENTFFPNASSKVLSLSQIFLWIRHTGHTVDDLPDWVRSDYERALPALRERHRRVPDPEPEEEAEERWGTVH